jgi:hypothetical protein
MADTKLGDRDGEVYVARDPDWRVEYFDRYGGCYVTIFSGPMAEQRAHDYCAAVRNSSLRRYDA